MLAEEKSVANSACDPMVTAAVHQQILARPTGVAIKAGNRQLTYSQLGDLSTQLRKSIRSTGVKRADIVAVWTHPCPEFVAAAFAIMSAGAAYLPIDENCPAERVAFMCADSGARALVTTSRLSASLRHPIGIPVIEVDRTQEAAREAKPDGACEDLDSGSLAYLIYTSGSTGQPKAVEIMHRGLSNLVAWHNEAFAVTRKDRGSQIAGLSFDAAAWEIWPYLVSGATLCIASSEARYNAAALQKWLVDERITVAFVPTILAEHLIEMKWPSKPALRVLLTGGEALRTYPPKNLPFAVVNNYGVTECTVVTISCRVMPNDGSCDAPPIGRPIRNAEILIAGADLKPVEAGHAGELCIGGPSLARGYHNRPELTREKFISHPLCAGQHARLYRTGDLVEMRDDGQLHFLGRVDDQVKIRGFRIEPNEIATTLRRHPGVRQCAVIGRNGSNAEKQLVAYIVPFNGKNASAMELREFLGKTLPDYMIPSVFVTLDELPLTVNGKLDVAALPSRQSGHGMGYESAQPASSDLEDQIAAIVRELLGIDDIGVADNFFLLGGHSLFGAQLISRLAKQFKVDVPLLAVFESPTVSTLAAAVQALRATQSQTQPDILRHYGATQK